MSYGPYHRYYEYTSRGVNSQGNAYDSRDYGNGANAYHYSNVDGGYYYANPDGGTYYNNGRGQARYISPDGRIKHISYRRDDMHDTEPDSSTEDSSHAEYDPTLYREVTYIIGSDESEDRTFEDDEPGRTVYDETDDPAVWQGSGNGRHYRDEPYARSISADESVTSSRDSESSPIDEASDDYRSEYEEDTREDPYYRHEERRSADEDSVSDSDSGSGTGLESHSDDDLGYDEDDIYDYYD